MNAAEKKAARDAADAQKAKTATPPATEQTQQTPAPQAGAPQADGVETAAASSDPKTSQSAMSPHSQEDWAEFLQWQAARGRAADAAEDALSGAVPAHVIGKVVERQTVLPGDPLLDPQLTGAPVVSDEERKRRILEIQEQIQYVELQTKLVLLEQTQESNTQYKQSKEERARAAENAQRNLTTAAWTQKQIEAGCAHQTGGFGLEDLYQGDNKPSIICMDLPVAGRKYLLCFRCLKGIATPDPNLRLVDLEKYLTDMADYGEFLKLLRKSLSRPMSGPTFAFEKGGLPHNPEIV